MAEPTLASSPTVREMIELERRFRHPADAVSRTFADREQRASGSAPSDEEIAVFDVHEIRVGGPNHLAGSR